MSTRTNTGIVKWFNAEKGLYVFVHNSHFEGMGIKALTGGQKVQFNTTQRRKGSQANDLIIHQ
jgi:cold shock CspA family protein